MPNTPAFFRAFRPATVAVAALALAPATAGCDTLEDHVELGAIAMQLDKLDSAANTFSPLKAPEVSRSGPRLVPAGDKLLVVQGYDKGFKILADVEIYDPATNSFTRGASGPADAFADEVIVRPKAPCLVFDSNGANKRVDCYDVAANTWSTLPALPNQAHPTLGALGDDIYAIGSLPSDPGPGTKAFRLDPAGAAWQTVADVPAKCTGKSVLHAVEAELYFFGCAATDKKDAIFRYDPAADAWTELSLAMTTDGVGFDGFVADTSFSTTIGKEVLFFATVPHSSSSNISIFNPAAFDVATMKSGVRYAAQMPGYSAVKPTYVGAMGAFWMAIYTGSNTDCGSLLTYDLATDKWATRATRKPADKLCLGSVAALNDEIFMVTSLQDRSIAIQ